MTIEDRYNFLLAFLLLPGVIMLISNIFWIIRKIKFKKKCYKTYGRIIESKYHFTSVHGWGYTIKYKDHDGNNHEVKPIFRISNPIIHFFIQYMSFRIGYLKETPERGKILNVLFYYAGPFFLLIFNIPLIIISIIGILELIK